MPAVARNIASHEMMFFRCLSSEGIYFVLQTADMHACIT